MLLRLASFPGLPPASVFDCLQYSKQLKTGAGGRPGNEASCDQVLVA